MGACLSRKKDSSSSPSSLNIVSLNSAPKKFLDSDTPLKLYLPELQFKGKLPVEEEKEKKKKQVSEEEESSVKKEIFVIKHRKSHDRERPSVSKGSGEDEEEHHNVTQNCSNNVVVRTSSCTKEEVDAILIQCGRLSRSNSSGTVAAKAASSGRKHAGSKRSYDLDQEQDEFAAADYEARKRGNGNGNGSYCNDDEGEEENEDRRQHRQRHRQSGRRTHSSPSQGRRRTPSRERDREQRSGSSRERGNGSGTSSGRRVSRSPGRRSETTPTPNANATANTTTSRPGKLVSVPATVSSLTMDKSNNAVEPQTGATAIKRISVKRNAGEAAGSRAAASPRSKSPARCNAKGGGSNENNQQQPSLSRSNSRKAEHSPYRRNPLSELDPNSLVYAPTTTTTGNNKTSNGTGTGTGRVQTKNREAEVKEVVTQKPNADANNNRVASQGTNKIVKEQTVVVEEAKAMPQTLTRSRSGRRSRDFDMNPETLVNPNPSYTALLLEDIHNFHQKNTNTNVIAPSFSVPACVTKACSILEAVADLNSATSSNLSCAFAEDNRIPATTTLGKKVVDAKDPFVESEVVVSDDLMEPSLHKYVTVRRGGNGTLSGEDMDGQESSGSNSFAGGSSHNNQWGYSTSSWEPNSADSTDRWASRSNTTEDDERSPLGFQKHVISETGLDVEEARRGFSGQRTGIGRRFINPIVAAAST